MLRLSFFFTSLFFPPNPNVLSLKFLFCSLRPPPTFPLLSLLSEMLSAFPSSSTWFASRPASASSRERCSSPPSSPPPRNLFQVSKVLLQMPLSAETRDASGFRLFASFSRSIYKWQECQMNYALSKSTVVFRWPGCFSSCAFCNHQAVTSSSVSAPESSLS